MLTASSPGGCIQGSHRSGVVFLQVGKVRADFGIAVGADVEIVVQILALANDLFFEKRVQDDRRRARIFHALMLSSFFINGEGDGRAGS